MALAGSDPAGRTSRTPRDGGFVAGAEALVFGVLVFVFGTLVILNGWAVVDAKFVTNAAAREAVRAIVQGSDGADAAELRARAGVAAADAVAAHGYEPGGVTLTHLTALPARRCEPVRVRAQITVDSTIVPRIAGPVTFHVASDHEQLIDPFRSGLDGEAGCGF